MGSGHAMTRSALLSAAGETDAGRRREQNHDYVLIRKDLGLFVVADGVGSEKRGEIASRLAALSMANFFEATADGSWPDEYRGIRDLTLNEDAQRLCAAIRKANYDVHAATAEIAGDGKTMGTTVVAIYVPYTCDSIHIAHVGDSRCYRIHDGRIEQLTRDHTLRNQARDQFPDIDDERIEQIPASVLYRAVGRGPEVELDIRSLPPHPGDRYLLCSDGVTNMVSDARILGVVNASASPLQACQLLVDLSNEYGGRDNISALCVWFDGQPT